MLELSGRCREKGDMDARMEKNSLQDLPRPQKTEILSLTPRFQLLMCSIDGRMFLPRSFGLTNPRKVKVIIHEHVNLDTSGSPIKPSHTIWA